MSQTKKPNLLPVHQDYGIVFSGGGARGAYQAGAARALFELCQQTQNFAPFGILSGVSAGAINSTFLAGEMDDLDRGTKKLVDLWRNLQAERVFRTDSISISRNALRLVRGVSLGGISGRLRPISAALLDNAPLAELIKTQVRFDQIRRHIAEGRLKALSVSATNYATSLGVTFVEGAPEVPMWTRAARRSERAQIGPEHVLASSAIPLFFPATCIQDHYFGDGSLRNTAPLSPAIHLGAQNLVVIGVRSWRQKVEHRTADAKEIHPTLGRILSILIDAIFMDAIETDMERLERINKSVSLFSAVREHLKDQELPALNVINTLYLYPSQRLALIAEAHRKTLPKMIGFLVDSLGSPKESAELLSYLLFEPEYCSALVDLGYKDVYDKKDEVLAFLSPKG